VGGQVVSITSGCPLPLARTPQYTIGWEAGWVLEHVLTEARGKILCLCWGSKLGSPVCSQDAILTELLQSWCGKCIKLMINIVNLSCNTEKKTAQYDVAVVLLSPQLTEQASW
jgi:hypothetical protein